MLRKKQRILLLVSLLSVVFVNAQENSPFSRYGLGDAYSNQNVRYLGIGGMTAALGNQQALNTSNPASYSNLRTSGAAGGLVTFDLGLSIQSNNLKSTNPFGSYNSANFTPTYFSLGVPLAKNGLGMVFGLKPITRINYSVEQLQSNPVSGYPDSVHHYSTVYNGSGGLNQVFLGFGKKIGSLSVGVNFGYDFGKKDINTKTVYDSSLGSVIDLTQVPTKGSIKNSHTSYGGFVWEGGIQYAQKIKEHIDPDTKITNSSFITFGATASIKQNIKSKQNSAFYTYYAQDPNNAIPQDTISSTEVKNGTVTLPAVYKIGIMYDNYQEGLEKWGLGVEYNDSKWGSDYKEDGISETSFKDSWMVRGGLYISPNPTRGKSLFARSKYSLGFYTGKSNLMVNQQDYKVQAITLGMAFPLRNFNRLSRQYSLINTSLEFGKRGGNNNNITESFFKLSFGFSLSDIWFTKRRYQ